jgi:diguanylate cyclase (GGDEF)-like protein
VPTTDAGRGGHDRRWIRSLSDEDGSISSTSFTAMAAAMAVAEAELAAEEAADTREAVLVAADNVTRAAAAAALTVSIAANAHASVVAQAAVLAAQARGRRASDCGQRPDPEIACALAATVASAALAEAELAALAVAETQRAVLAAARTVAGSASVAAMSVATVLEETSAAVGKARAIAVPQQQIRPGQESVKSVAATVASAALAEAELAAGAVVATQEAVLTAARTVAVAAAAAAETVATAVAAKATVVAAAAAAAAAARSTEDKLRREDPRTLSYRRPLTGRPPYVFVRPRRGTAISDVPDTGRGAGSTESIALTVASTAMAEAELAAQAVVDTQAAVVTAARIVAEAAASAAQTVAAAVTEKASVVAAAAAAAVMARSTEDRLRHDVLHDDLTGLANRRLLLEHLTHALARSGRAGTNVTVLFLDVDNFKQVNDEFGHSVGDQLLIRVADQLRALLRESDACARVGGDEFVVVLDDGALSRTEGWMIADRIKASFASGVALVGATQQVHIQVSIGLAMSSPSSLPGDLLEEADLAMYHVKEQARSARGRFNRRRRARRLRSFDNATTSTTIATAT